MKLEDIFPYRIMREEKIKSEFGELTNLSSTCLVFDYYLVNLNRIFLDQALRESNKARTRAAYIQ